MHTNETELINRGLRQLQNLNILQIHIGNNTRQMHGCILVGTSSNIYGCTIDDSAAAYNKMKQVCYFSDY